MIDTDKWPLVLAMHYKVIPMPPRRVVRVLMIHVADAPEKGNTAESVGLYFKNGAEGRIASAHVGADADSIVQYVPDQHVAYAAPGCNHDGIQIELAGYTAQTDAQWADPYSINTINMGALATAQYCLKYGIPCCHLTNTQLRDGEKGIAGHYQATEVYPAKDRTHTDPGPNFPWELFMERVAVHLAERKRRFGVA
jgi:N-acetyl-anhydromuramyl-L-alanine amidase AmpD